MEGKVQHANATSMFTVCSTTDTKRLEAEIAPPTLLEGESGLFDSLGTAGQG